MRQRSGSFLVKQKIALELAVDGMTHAQIAQKLKCSRSYVGQLLGAAGFTKTKEVEEFQEAVDIRLLNCKQIYLGRFKDSHSGRGICFRFKCNKCGRRWQVCQSRFIRYGEGLCKNKNCE